FTNVDDLPTDPFMSDLEDTADLLNTGIFSGAYDDEDVGAEADLNNLETTMSYTQEEGTDYDEDFAPIARIKAIKLFLAYASFMGFIVYQIDVKSAFLYDTIKEEVMQRDDGIFISQDKYVVDILKKFDFVIMKKESSPIETHKAFLKDEEAEDVDVHLYK
ncbi:ribonuclease H-like domain-containing protein, partial [Tanacetum coccineum]